MEKYICILWNEKKNLKYTNNIISLINDKFEITYMFDMKCNDPYKFISIFYYFHNWTSKPNRGFLPFTVICFNDYFPKIEYKKIKQGYRYININTYELKNYIRNKYNSDPLIHISDNFSEIIHNCSILLLFQKNEIYKNNLIYTIRYENEKLNMNNINKSLEIFSKKNNDLFNKFKNIIKNSNYNIDDFCIDGSFILSILGIREARDLNFICLDNNISFNIENIQNHKDILKNLNLPYSKIDILYNPNNHFIFNGIKCINLYIYKQIKINRLLLSNKNSFNYIKDTNDLVLINKYIT